MFENTFKSLEERMDAQLTAFGAMPEEQEQKRRPGVRGAVQAGVLAGGAYSVFKKRDSLKAGAKTGLFKAAKGTDLLGGKLGKVATAPGAGASRIGRVAGKGSSAMVDAGRLLRKGARAFSRAEADAVIELAERIALIELEDAGDVREFAGSVDPLKKAATAGMAKMRGGAGKAAGWAKANPKLAAKAGGVGLLAGGVVASRVKHDMNKKKRREELLARFKGGSRPQ